MENRPISYWQQQLCSAYKELNNTILNTFTVGDFINQKQALRFFDIDKTTLARWCKNHQISPAIVGRKKYYKVTEISHFLNNLKK